MYSTITNLGGDKPNIRNHYNKYIGSDKIVLENLPCVTAYTTLNEYICANQDIDLQQAYDNGDGSIILDSVDTTKSVVIRNDPANKHDELFLVTNGNGLNIELGIYDDKFIAQNANVTATGANIIAIGHDSLVQDQAGDPTREVVSIGIRNRCDDSYSILYGSDVRLINESNFTCEAHVLLGYDIECKADNTATKISDYCVIVGIGAPNQPCLLNSEHTHLFGRSEVANIIQADHCNFAGHFFNTDDTNHYYNYVRGCNIGLINNCQNNLIHAVNYAGGTTRTTAGPTNIGTNPAFDMLDNCQECVYEGINNIGEGSRYTNVIGKDNITYYTDYSVIYGYNIRVGDQFVASPNYSGGIGSNIENYADNSLAFSNKSGIVTNPATNANQVSFFFEQGLNLYEDSADLTALPFDLVLLVPVMIVMFGRGFEGLHYVRAHKEWRDL